MRRCGKFSKTMILILTLVLALCSVFSGTIAWFTDEVTSTSNQLVTGTLKLGVEYTTDGSEWLPVEEDTVLFSEDVRWEPGFVQAIGLRITNEGSLSLRYKAGAVINQEIPSVNTMGEDFKLSDSLRSGFITVADETELTRYLNSRSDAETIATIPFADTAAIDPLPHTLDAGECHTALLTVCMPSTVGNEANHRSDVPAPQVQFGLALLAAQNSAENDAFGNDYDADAVFPELKPSIPEGQNLLYAADQNQLLTAVAAVAGGEEPAGTMIILTDDILLDETLVIPAGFDGVLDLQVYTLRLRSQQAAGLLRSAKAASLTDFTDNVLHNQGKLVLRAVNDHTTPNVLGIVNSNQLTIESGYYGTDSQQDYALLNTDEGSLTITGSDTTIENKESNASAIASDSGSVVIDDGQIIGSDNAVSVTGGTAAINGGTLQITNENDGVVLNIGQDAEKVEITGGQLDAGSADGGSVTVNSGVSGDQLEISGGELSEDSNLSEEHYAPAAPTPTPTPTPTPAPTPTPTPAPTLEPDGDGDLSVIETEWELTQLFQNGGTAQLGANISLTRTLTVPEGVSVTLNWDWENEYTLTTSAALEAMIENNGTLKLYGSSEDNPQYLFFAESGSDVDWAVINQSGAAFYAHYLYAGRYTNSLICNNGGTVSILGGNWSTDSTAGTEPVFCNNGGSTFLEYSSGYSASSAPLFYCTGEDASLAMAYTGFRALNGQCGKLAVAENGGLVRLGEECGFNWFGTGLDAILSGNVEQNEMCTINLMSDDPETININSEADLASLMRNGGSGELMASIQLSDTMTVPEGVTVKLDTHRYTISGKAGVKVFFENNGNLTLFKTDTYNTTIYDASSDPECLFQNNATGELLLNGIGIRTNSAGMICNNGGHVIVAGGTWDNATADGADPARYAVENKNGDKITLSIVTIKQGGGRTTLFSTGSGSSITANNLRLTANDGYIGHVASTQDNGTILLQGADTSIVWYGSSRADLCTGDVTIAEACSVTLKGERLSPISDLEQLTGLMTNGGRGILLSDIFLTEGLTVPGGVTVVLELADHALYSDRITGQLLQNNGELTISCTGILGSLNSNTAAEALLCNNGILTLENISLSNIAGTMIRNNGTLTCTNITGYCYTTEYGESYTGYAFTGSGTAILNGSTVYVPSGMSGYESNGAGSAITLNDCNLYANDAGVGLMAQGINGGSVTFASGYYQWYGASAESITAGDVTISDDCTLTLE